MGDGLSQTTWERLDEARKRLAELIAAIRDVEYEVREQAVGEQDGYLLDIANRLAAALRNKAN